MKLDFQSREMTIKLVYYGPALSGKTTNLQSIHEMAEGLTAGRLMTLETRDDRTLFFDLLPLKITTESNLNIRFKLFTVPGQVVHEATRKLVLQGADGIAFIADSQNNQTQANKEAFLDMHRNLKANGFDPKTHPTVIQFNKRDMHDIRTDEAIEAMAKASPQPIYKATAIKHEGVIETLVGLIGTTWKDLEERHKLHEKFGIEPSEFLDTVRTALPPKKASQ